MTVFQGNHLFLRPLIAADRDNLYTILSDPAVSGPIVFITQPYDLAQADAWCNRADAGRQDGTEWLFTIVAGVAGEGPEQIIGHAGLHKDKNAPTDKPEAEIGYWLSRDCWGKGLASEVAGLLVEAGRHYGFYQLQATTADDNPASGRVLNKNGFGIIGSVQRKRPDGTMRNSVFYHRLI